MNRVRSLFENMLAAGLVELLRWLFGLAVVSTMAGAAARYIASMWTQTQPYTVFIIVGVVGSAGVLWTWLYARFSLFYPERVPRSQFDYLILEKRIRLQVVDEHHKLYRKIVRLKALRQGLNRYEDRYQFSGDGDIKIASKQTDQQVVELPWQDLWAYYEIRFNRTLNRGDIIETDVLFDIKDQRRPMNPYINADIAEPTKLLIMEVEIPDRLGVREMVQETCSTVGAKRPKKTSTDEMRHGECTWTIRRPRLLHSYKMKWWYEAAGGREDGPLPS